MEVEMKGGANFLAQSLKNPMPFPTGKISNIIRTLLKRKSVALCQDILIRNIGCDKSLNCSICTCTGLWILRSSYLHLCRYMDPQIFTSLSPQIYESSDLHIQIYVSSDLHTSASVDPQIPSICRSSDPSISTSMDPHISIFMHWHVSSDLHMYFYIHGSIDV